jgi:hypothetical protein
MDIWIFCIKNTKMDVPMLQLKQKKKMLKHCKVKEMRIHNHPRDSIQYVGSLLEFLK